MKKYRSYIIITSVLALIALYYFVYERKGTLNLDVNYFALADTSEISRITILSNSQKIVLEQSGDNWVVNKNYNAKIKLIKGLLGLLTTLEINAPVPRSLQQEVLEKFRKQSIRVKFETNTRTVKEFDLCDIDSLQLGTFIREPESNDVYIARIPGFDNSVTKFFPPIVQIWRDNIIFRYKPWEILNIKVDYPAQSKASFFLNLSNPDRILLSNIENSEPIELKKEEIVRYLLNFQSIPFYPLNIYRKELFDSLKNSKPFCKFEIKNIDNQTVVLSTYTIPENLKIHKVDLNKMYAVLQNDTNPVLVKYTDIDLIMKKYQEIRNH